MGLENNKAAHHIRISDNKAVKITHIGWSNSFVGRTSERSTQKKTAAWNKLSSEDSDIYGNSLPVDLPRELTFLEVETALPKVSPLPTSSAGAGQVPGLTRKRRLSRPMLMTSAEMMP
jgi:anaphase-promoting complex subunit 4